MYVQGTYDFRLLYLMNQSICNSEIIWDMQKHLQFTRVQCEHHETHSKYVEDTDVFSVRVVPLLHQLQKSHVTFLPVPLIGTLAKVVYRHDP